MSREVWSANAILVGMCEVACLILKFDLVTIYVVEGPFERKGESFNYVFWYVSSIEISGSSIEVFHVDGPRDWSRVKVGRVWSSQLACTVDVLCSRPLLCSFDVARHWAVTPKDSIL